jgi:S1-C subfamily serine protease
VGGSKEHDLALLKVEATGLLAATWAKADGLHVGQVVASLGPDPRPLHFGVVGGRQIANPAVKGFLPINGQPTTPEGLSGHVFTEVWDKRPDVGDLRERLKAGDLITHVDDVPTPTPEEYLKVRDKRMAAPDALMGERVKLTVRRGKETLQVFAPIVPSAYPPPFRWKECPLSLRRNGFPAVFAHDGGIGPEQCGGPVVDRTGRVVGLNIARADEVQTFAIPSDVAEKAVAEMWSTAEQK